MKKILSILVISVFLPACSSTASTLSFSELEMVAEELRNVMDPTAELQLINGGEDIAYIVYQFEEVVAADVGEDGETLKVNLNVDEEGNGIPEQHVYKLTLNEEHEIIEVFINGESTPFDVVSGL